MNYSSTQLVANNSQEEINKALLDLLAKINALSSSTDASLKTLNVQDGLGHTVHQAPDGNVLNQSYPMGHLYLFRNDIVQYQIWPTGGPTHQSAWNTVLPTKAGVSNINGVRIKITVDNVISPASATASRRIFVCPTGSSWDTVGILPSFWHSTNGFSSASDFITETIFDVPIGTNGSFDFMIIDNGIDPIYTVIIQQLGVWI